MSERRDRVLRDVDVSEGHGLEIGPLHTPFVTKAEADVVYVDIHPTEELRDYYGRHPRFRARDIVEVDYPLLSGDGMHSIAEVTSSVAPFDWVIASHVMEHVPDLVRWLQDIAAVLRDGGMLSLVVPDRRYTFDAIRPATTVGQILQAFYDRDERPSIRAVFDHHHAAVHVPPRAPLATEETLIPDGHIHDLGFVGDLLAQAGEGTEYFDAHVWVWTPQELVDQLSVLASLDFIDFTVASLIPTPMEEIEFFVTLQRLPRDCSPEQRADLLNDRLVTARHVLTAPPPPAALRMHVSASEQRLLTLKRTLLTTARSVLRSLLRRKTS
jgi:SAM-dependent methyltransferase